MKGHIRDADLMRRAVQEADAVAHLPAPLPSASERERQATMSVNVQDTQNLVQTLKQENQQTHLAFSSSVCVYYV